MRPWFHRNRRAKALSGAVVLCLAAWFPATSAAAQTDVCAPAAERLTQGDLPGAEDAYRAIAAEHPDAPCVASGRRSIAYRRCQAAEQKFRAGESDKAREAYLQILDAYRDTPCAVAGLAALDGTDPATVSATTASSKPPASSAPTGEASSSIPPAGAVAWGSGTATTANPIEAAAPITGATETIPAGDPRAGVGGSSTDSIEALRMLGRHEEALARATELAADDPDGVMLYAQENSWWARWSRLGTLWDVYLKPLISMVCVALIIALGVMGGRKLWLVRGRLKLEVDAFSAVAVPLPADPDRALVARVVQMLVRLGEDDELYRPDLIDKAVDLPEPPADLDPLPPQVSQLWSFFNRLVPAKTVALSGVLQHSERNGAGLSLKLVYRRTGALWGTHTLWQAHVDPSFVPGQGEPTVEDYLALAETAAIWTYWKLVQRKARLPDEESVPDLRKAFGTDNWRSHAASKAGAKLIELGRLAEAERLTRMALTFDRANRHALFNLATIEVQSLSPTQVREDPSAYDEARSHYEDVERLSGLSDQQGDRLHILADYQRGALEQYQFLLSDGSRGDLAQAQRLLGRAETHAVAAFGENDVVTKMVTIARCSAQTLAGDATDDLADTIRGIERRYFAPRLMYTLACFSCARAVAERGAPADGDPAAALDRAWNHLRDALRTDPAYAGWALRDPSLEPLRASRKDRFAELLGTA